MTKNASARERSQLEVIFQTFKQIPAFTHQFRFRFSVLRRLPLRCYLPSLYSGSFCCKAERDLCTRSVVSSQLAQGSITYKHVISRDTGAGATLSRKDWRPVFLNHAICF